VTGGAAEKRLRLARGSRLELDPVSGETVLLYPEGALFLNETAAAVLAACDGRRTMVQIFAELQARYDGVLEHEVDGILTVMQRRGLLAS
jgi:coenzyme PQQ biosynthesis protein PqqD